MPTQHAKAELTMLSEVYGGRKKPLDKDFLFGYTYRPHIVIENLSVRKIHQQMKSNLVKEDVSGEDYLGVAFSSASGLPLPNCTIVVEFAYVYHNNVSYSKAVEGALYTLREGSKIVGIGKIISTFTKDVDFG